MIHLYTLFVLCINMYMSTYTTTHCKKHGGGKNKPCSVVGCTTTSNRKGHCAKHGGRNDECVFGGYINQ